MKQTVSDYTTLHFFKNACKGISISLFLLNLFWTLIRVLISEYIYFTHISFNCFSIKVVLLYILITWSLAGECDLSILFSGTEIFCWLRSALSDNSVKIWLISVVNHSAPFHLNVSFQVLCFFLLMTHPLIE